MDPARPATEADFLAELDRRLRAVERPSMTVEFGTWAPTLTQSAAVTHTVTYAWYARVGSLVHAQAYLVATGSGTANNPLRVSLPVPAVQPGLPCGALYWFDSPSTNFVVPAWIPTTGTAGGLLSGSGSQLGQTATVGGIVYANQVVSGDSILLDAHYEAAA